MSGIDSSQARLKCVGFGQFRLCLDLCVLLRSGKLYAVPIMTAMCAEQRIQE
jgi:hypothetical protein